MTDIPRPTILFASGNPTKHLIYRPLLMGMGFDVHDLSQAHGIREDSPVEDADTVTQNAAIKAAHYRCASYPHVFAHDVGLCFDALDDEPGVQARRWGGKLDENISDDDWMTYLLERMQNVPDDARTGRFIVGWALAIGDEIHTLYQESPFRIAHAPLRPMTAGSPMTALIHGGENVIAQRQAVFNDALTQWAPLRALTMPQTGE